MFACATPPKPVAPHKEHRLSVPPVAEMFGRRDKDVLPALCQALPDLHLLLPQIIITNNLQRAKVK